MISVTESFPVDRSSEFDEIASEYGKLWTARLYDNLIVSALPPNCGFVLDLGCSTGALTEKLSANAEHVLAIDASSKALDLARQKVTAPNVEFKRQSIENAPEMVKPGSCDAIVASRSLHHCEALPSLIRALVSLLNTNGRLIILELYGTGIYAGNKVYRNFINIAYKLNILVNGLRQHCFSTALNGLRQEGRFFSTDAWQSHMKSEPNFNSNTLLSLMKTNKLFTTSSDQNTKFRLFIGEKHMPEDH